MVVVINKELNEICKILSDDFSVIRKVIYLICEMPDDGTGSLMIDKFLSEPCIGKYVIIDAFYIAFEQIG